MKLDLRKAFYQLRITLDDEFKIVFCMRYRYFKYLVISFRLTNTPGMIQSYINDCLCELLDSICIVYLDNILIYSNSYEEHMQHVRQVLLKLRQFGLICKLLKCEFSIKKISFLGYEILSEGVSIDPKCITAILR